MAVSEELKIVVRAEARQAINELKQVQGTSRKVTNNFASMAKSLIGPIGVTAGVVLLTRKLSQGIQSSIRYAASMEKIGVAFETMLGSAKLAQSLIEDIRQFSISTPFEFKNLAPAAQRLIAFGTAAEDVVQVMRDLGNAAMGDQAILDRLTLAYGKLQAKGRASLEELNMFTEAGVPILKALETQLGLTKEELFDYITQGKVGFEDVNQALQDLTRGEGQFAGMLAKQSETLEGRLSTLSGAISDLGGALADDFLPFLTKTVELITEIVDRFSTSISFADALKGIGFGTLSRNLPSDFARVPGGSRQEIADEALRRLILVEAAASGFRGELAGRAEGRIFPTTEATFVRTDEKLRDLRDQADALGSALRSVLDRLGVTAPGVTSDIFTFKGETSTTGGATGGKSGGGTIRNALLWAIDNSRFFDSGPQFSPTSPVINRFGSFLGADNPAFGYGTQANLPGGGGRYAGMLPWTPGAGSQYAGVAQGLLSNMPGVDSGRGAGGMGDDADSIQDIYDTMSQMGTDGAVKTAVGLFKDFGAALATGADEGEVLAKSASKILNMMSEIFLWGALSAFKAGSLEMGLVFLGLAGVTGFVGGVAGSYSAPSSSSLRSEETRRSGGTVYGLNSNIQNPVIVQNIAGSVLTQDQLDANAANAARGITSGR